MTVRSLLPHDVTGEGREIGLLLLHPLGAQRGFWQAFVNAWSKRTSCVAVDLRNSIETPDGPRPVTIAQHVEDLESLRQALGFHALVPVGCAISTMIAASYAATMPQAISALVLSNATPRSSPQARAMLSARGETVRREGIAAILPQAVERAFLNQPKDARYEEYYQAFAGQSAENYAFACEASAFYDAGEALGQVKCPTLVVAGEHDVLLPPALSAEVADAVPNAKLHTMKSVAHFAPYQAPKEFARLVAEFLLEAGVVALR